MNQENTQVQYIEEDTIDLRELWATIIQRKMVVIGIVTVVTIMSAIYAWMLKPVVPLYEASTLVEIGQSIEEKNKAIRGFETSYDLQNILERVTSITVVVPKRTMSLLLLSSSNVNEETAKQELEVGIDFIMKRHREMAVDYGKVRMSQVVGEVKVVNVAKQPKKKLIVAVSFVSSLIFALFLVFFLEFIRGEKKDETKSPVE